VEAVLCYRDIQRFKKTTKRRRNKFASILYQTYLKLDAPVQLNMPGALMKAGAELQMQLSSNERVVLETNCFDKFEIHCLSDMTDVFERLKTSSYYPVKK